MKLWFKAKQYGWGWYPATWQGWTIMLIWTALVILITSTTFKNNPQSANDIVMRISLPIILLTVLIIFIAWGTGEKPQWRWGNKSLNKKT